MPNISQKLDRLTTSAIGEMVLLARELGAINLASGDPDFNPPAELIEAAQRALQEGHNQLGDTRGDPAFRQALARKQSRFMGIEIDPDDHVTVTCGATEAIASSLMTVCDPGDRVILFSPFYEAHVSAPLLASAEPVFISLRPPDFSLDPQELRRAFQRGAKALILCNPSNPTGKVFTVEELQIIADLAQEYDSYVITDETYEHVVYPPHKHIYIASLPGMFERTISCSSLSKTYHMTGWRLGYAIAPAELSSQIRTVHAYLSLSASEPLIQAAITALQFPDIYYENLLRDYTRKRDLFCDLLAEAGLNYIQPQGAFFTLMDISPFGFTDDNEFCYWLVRQKGIAAAPGSSFFHEPVHNYIRLTYAKRNATLIEAGRRMLRIAPGSETQSGD